MFPSPAVLLRSGTIELVKRLERTPTFAPVVERIAGLKRDCSEYMIARPDPLRLSLFVW